MSNNNQIQQGGVEFQTNQVLTADRLNDLIGKSSLRKGAITEQTTATEVSANDEMLLARPSNADDIVNKCTIAQALGSGSPVVSSEISAKTLNSSTQTLAASGTNGVEINALVNHKNSVSVSGPFDPGADVLVIGGGAVKIPSGPTSARPSASVDGRFYFNTDTKRTEYSRAGNWVPTGTTMFATGGNKLIAPSAEVMTAQYEIAPSMTFPASGNFANPRQAPFQLSPYQFNELLIHKQNHGISEGQLVVFTDTGPAIAGYTSKPDGEHVCCRVIDADKFVVKMHPAQTTGNYFFADVFVDKIRGPATGGTQPLRACTFRRSGSYRCHIYDQPGIHSFDVQGQGGHVEVLVVGGGSVHGTAGRFAHIQRYKVQDNQSVTVVVGEGGQQIANGTTTPSGNREGGLSSFGNVIAYGGNNSVSQFDYRGVGSLWQAFVGGSDNGPILAIYGPDPPKIAPRRTLYNCSITGYPLWFGGMPTVQRQSYPYDDYGLKDAQWLIPLGLNLLDGEGGRTISGKNGTGSAGGIWVLDRNGYSGRTDSVKNINIYGGCGCVIVRYPYYT